MKTTLVYEIQLQVNDDIPFAYFGGNTKPEADQLYELLIKGMFAKGQSLSSEIIHEPIITMLEQVLDSNETVKAERIIRRHKLGDEESESVESKLESGFEITYDLIDYYKSNPSIYMINVNEPAFGLTL